MKPLLILLPLVVSCSIVYVEAAGRHEDSWKSHQLKYPTKSKNPVELQRQLFNFNETDRKVKQHNQIRNATYKMGHNEFSTMDKNEVKKYLNNDPPTPPPVKDTVNVTSVALNITLRDLPIGVDYRCHPCLQPVKDQGVCGGCWAFGATAPIEFRRCYITGNPPLTLSEQQLLDCNVSGQQGCKGGFLVNAWQYLIQSGGLATSALYPYRASNGNCRFNTAMVGAKLSTTNPILVFPANSNNTVPYMKAYLNSGYLIGVVIDVVASFLNYQSGIYSDPDCRITSVNFRGNHVVTIVGYGTLNGMDYWIIRNSWSSNWGVNGYVLFQRGVNMCRIEEFAATINVQ